MDTDQMESKPVLLKVVRKLSQLILNRMWYSHPPVILFVRATSAVCLRTLADAARPSTERLHLRNLFTGGRRYFLYPFADGFQMHTTSKTPWQRRRRTRIAAVLFAKVSEAGAEITRVQLRTRMNTLYLLDVLILPLWMSILLLFGPIPKTWAVPAIAALFTLSWLWHRYNALLQSAEMIYFVQVALDDLNPTDIPILGASVGNIVYSDFQAEWEKFYERHKDES